MACNIINNKGVTSVFNNDGTESNLYKEAVKFYDGNVESALNLWAVTMEDNYEAITRTTSKETTVEDALRYLNTQEYTKESFRLSENELLGVKGLLNNTQFESVSDLYDQMSKLFKPEGYFEIDAKRLLASGLYTQQEIDSLNPAELNKTLSKLGIEAAINDTSSTVNTVSNIKDTSSPKNLLGMHSFVTEAQVIDFILENGVDALADSPYSFVSKNQLEGIEEKAKVIKNDTPTIKVPVKDANENSLQDIKAKTIADGTFMKAPNGNPTNLSEKQWLQVQTLNFKKWFGDSKVVDSNNEPLPVFHGTNAEFSEFSTEYNEFTEGIFFSTKEDVASYYGNTSSFFISASSVKEVGSSIQGAYDLGEIKGTDFDAVWNKGTNEIIVGNPNQIKSATDNTGEFSAETDNIFDTYTEQIPEPQVQVFGQSTIDKANEYRQVPKLFTDTEGNLTNTNLSTETTLNNTLIAGIDPVSFRVDNDYLQDLDSEVWRENIDDVRKVLKAVETRLIESNIDVIGLSEIAESRQSVLELHDALTQLAENPSKVNISNFSQVKDRILGEDGINRNFTDTLPKAYENLSIVNVHANKSENNLFKEDGLIKVADGYYHKVEKESSDVMYDFLYRKYIKGELAIPQRLITVKDPMDAVNQSEVIENIRTFVNSRDVGFKTDVETNEKISLAQLAYDHLPLEKTQIRPVILENADYLKTGFISDFYNYVLREKSKNSDVYNKTLKHFKITDADIVYDGREALNIDGLEYQQELRDYASLKKEPGKLKDIIDYDGTLGVTSADLEAINRPQDIKTEITNYTNIDNIVITEKTPEAYAKADGKLYRKVLDSENHSAYQEINVGEGNNIYFDTNVNFETNTKDIARKLNEFERNNFNYDNKALESKEISKNLGRIDAPTTQALDMGSKFGIVVENVSSKVKDSYDSCL